MDISHSPLDSVSSWPLFVGSHRVKSVARWRITWRRSGLAAEGPTVRCNEIMNQTYSSLDRDILMAFYRPNHCSYRFSWSSFNNSDCHA